MLNAGRLNRRVTFQQRGTSVDAAGQPVETWSDVATVWADVMAPRGTSAAERVVANREGATVAYSVRMRWRTDITTGMRALIDGQAHDVAQVVQDLAGREYVDAICVAGAT